MSLIVEWSSGLYTLEHTFEALPELVLSLEETHPAREGEGSMVFYHWVSGVDFDEFESAIGDDPHCRSVAHLSDVGDRRLYRVRASEAGMRAVLYPVAAEHDVVVLETTLTCEGIQTRARVPSREVLTTVRDAVADRGVWFSLDRLYREQSEGAGYGVTDSQRDALLAALEAGYFDVPRRTTLDEMAEEFAISDQAFSARLRRGQAGLLRNTLAAGGT